MAYLEEIAGIARAIRQARTGEVPYPIDAIEGLAGLVEALATALNGGTPTVMAFPLITPDAANPSVVMRGGWNPYPTDQGPYAPTVGTLARASDFSAFQVFNIFTYGAQAIGPAHDDQDAAQLASVAAKNAIAAGQCPGAVVWLPGGGFFFNGGSGTVPNPTPGTPSVSPMGSTIAPGPVLLWDNIWMVGSGTEQTVISCGANYYNGALNSPPKVSGPLQPTDHYNGRVIANYGYWIGWDGTDYISNNVKVKDLTIIGNGHLATSAGQVYAPPNPWNQPVNTILNGSLVQLSATYNGTVDNVKLYDSTANGIFVLGRFPGSGVQPVPECNFRISRCSVNLNFPIWLSGSSWYNSANGQPGGSLPVRTEGISNGEVTFNNVGDLNVGNSTLPGNTNDAIDVPTTGNLLVHGNRATLCGDGIGTNGESNVTITANIVYMAGSVGLASYKSSTGVATSNLTISANIVYQAGSNGPANPCLNIDSGSLQSAVVGNVFMSAFGTTPAIVNFVGDNMTFSTNYVGMMGTANSVGLRLSGSLNNSTVSTNIFDFGGAATSIGLKLGTCSNCAFQSNLFANAGSTCIGIQLPTANTYTALSITQNSFDSTIDSNSGNIPINILVPFSSITFSSIFGNPGITGAWLNATYGQGPVTPSPSPPFTTPFVNPWPWPAQLWIGPSGVFAGPVIIDNVTTVAGTTAPPAGGFVCRVPTGSSVALQWTAKPTGGWLWIFEAF